jgi:hypothetical protein
MRDQIVCQYCPGIVTGETGRTVLDDSGSLAITAWTCSRCGGVVEEIRILAQNGKAQPSPVRYAVASPHSNRPAQFAHRTLRN